MSEDEIHALLIDIHIYELIVPMDLGCNISVSALKQQAYRHLERLQRTLTSRRLIQLVKDASRIECFCYPAFS
jgi:hypothetical protein